MCKSATIRTLNNEFRTTLQGGRLMLTRGILDRDDANEIVKKVQRFDAFNNDNDPYREHDFGAFEMGRDSIFWKMDYYAKDLESASPDPSDATVTTRVLTILLAEEY
jgi:hypothetical protein